jgi:hypothetical protein
MWAVTAVRTGPYDRADFYLPSRSVGCYVAKGGFLEVSTGFLCLLAQRYAKDLPKNWTPEPTHPARGSDVPGSGGYGTALQLVHMCRHGRGAGPASRLTR